MASHSNYVCNYFVVWKIKWTAMQGSLFGNPITKLPTHSNAMNQSWPGRILLITFSILFSLLGLFLLQQESITLPGRLTMRQYNIDSAGIVFVACSLFSLSLMLIMLAINATQFKRISTNLFIAALILFSIGFFI